MKNFVKGVFLGAIVPLGMCGFAFTVYRASKKKYEELEENGREKQKEWDECLDSLEKLMGGIEEHGSDLEEEFKKMIDDFIEDIESQKAKKIREGLLKDIDEYAADLEELYDTYHREYAIPYKELIMKHTK